MNITGYAYQPGDRVFVLDPKSKYWLQGIVKKFIPDYQRTRSHMLEPAYQVDVKRPRRVVNHGKATFKMIKSRFIATNGYVMHMDYIPLYDVGQKAYIKKTGQPVVIIQALNRPINGPTYFVYNLDSNRKHMIKESKLDEKPS